MAAAGRTYAIETGVSALIASSDCDGNQSGHIGLDNESARCGRCSRRRHAFQRSCAWRVQAIRRRSAPATLASSSRQRPSPRRNDRSIWVDSSSKAPRRDIRCACLTARRSVVTRLPTLDRPINERCAARHERRFGIGQSKPDGRVIAFRGQIADPWLSVITFHELEAAPA